MIARDYYIKFNSCNKLSLHSKKNSQPSTIFFFKVNKQIGLFTKKNSFNTLILVNCTDLKTENKIKPFAWLRIAREVFLFKSMVKIKTHDVQKTKNFTYINSR